MILYIKRGFTLIELLVVVLIIGILSAVAVSQYQKAVLKSRFSALMPIAKNLAEKNEVYFYENGTYTVIPGQLDYDEPEGIGRITLLASGMEHTSHFEDGLNVRIRTVPEGLSFVQVFHDDLPNIRYVQYQKQSLFFPAAAMCEAKDAKAEAVCASLGGKELDGTDNSTGESDWKAYVLSSAQGDSDYFPKKCSNGSEWGLILLKPCGQYNVHYQCNQKTGQWEEESRTFIPCNY